MDYKALQQIVYGNLGCLEFTADLCRAVGDLEGDFCEAGVAAGGQLVNMHECHPSKRIFAFDSFAGIPTHCDEDKEWTEAYGKGENDQRKSGGITNVPLENCKGQIRRFIPNLARFVFIPGWFIDTLPALTTERFSIVRLDCDLYESYKVCLKELYPRLTVGGYLIIDDWGLSGCQAALKEYFGDELADFVFDTRLGNAYLKKK